MLAVLGRGTYHCTAEDDEEGGGCGPLQWVELQTPAEQVLTQPCPLPCAVPCPAAAPASSCLFFPP